ncbi:MULTISPECIES: iron uptake transporter deferrochelatase/peroxidase subunit [Chromohalobacter]|uniref:Deferrochelatase n=1 Tax=Chromohalobacter moromii TaxID=2860329 RepID=A0A9X3AXR7_9GAMM|nr:MULTISPECIES: iron uptake transporter deferrochelatase/peroxidase subunit [Chromohalobacter]MCK2045975.1 deferrochelatase/peroxidase EfeB [Chromohalobacter moromii]MCT8500183.1 deferrochelatase/peroxidase EfeB [Chromohalobacter canadensis]MCT8505601.1 deferrochelatase/peroxidase EfeB [Chromohalobacter moromii]
MSDRPDNTSRCPFTLDRRRFLQGLGAAGAAAGLGGSAWAGSRDDAASAHAVTGAPVSTTTQQSHPFHGRHQQGILTPRPATGMVVVCDVLARDRARLERLLRILTERIAFLTQGGTYPKRDPSYPPADSGILGPTIAPDALTVTVSLGASVFDERFGLANAKPKHLQRMTEFPNDALEPARCHGDLSLQICANTHDTTIHALRDIIKYTPGLLMVRWKQEGTVPVMPPSPDLPAPSARNYLGFRDGTANPNTDDDALMNALVWTGADPDEPDWTHGGSYQVVRIIRNFVERWDRAQLAEQEAIFGRRKDSGAPLSGGSEYDKPDYANDVDGQITPLDAHIRLANPRTPGFEKHRILRRPFNYSNGVEANGQLDMGLLFIVYQADLEAGFITVQNRLNGEPLEEYIKPVGGGYFFTLPGAIDEHDVLGRSLLEATAPHA